jgi:glycosyltransferase involved in cell wall biosynthesis
MRILHVTDVYRPRVGGIELFVEGLGLRQAAAGHEVTVLTPTRAGSSTGPADLEVVRVPLGGYVPLRTLPVDLTSYDVVHAHLSVVSVFTTRVAKAAARAGVPVVNTVHSMWNGREGWVRIVGAIATWDRLPQVWTSVSRNAAATIEQVLSPKTDVRVVPNAVDVDWWHAGLDDRSATPGVTFATVMRLAGRKRPLQLVDMLAQVRLEVPPSVPLRAVIVGDGPLEERTRARIAALGLDWVTLTGELSPERVRAVYRAADVYVAPSHQESFGIAALEARAAGLPVVAMRSGGVGEFVRDGVEGLLCSDDDEMTDALTRLAADAPTRHAMSSHNRAHAPRHDWSLTLSGFEDAYAVAESRATSRRTRSSVAR